MARNYPSRQSDISPCKDCSERHTACHDQCQRYKDWKDEMEKIKQARAKYLDDKNQECASLMRRRKLRQTNWRGYYG